ncbi:MAG: 5'(3')-deoxyribonucleotidase [Bacteroidota bacterium]
MKKRILVDMDGVLADVYARLFEMHEKETGIKLTAEMIAGKLEEEAFPSQRKWVSEPGFFRTLPVMDGSREAMEKLNKEYDIVVVSLATEFPNSLTDKIMWLNDYFPFISWKQIVFCGDKSLIKADILIDDHPKNLDGFPGKTYIFTQPLNIPVKNSRHRRVNSWNEIEKLLLNR